METIRLLITKGADPKDWLALVNAYTYAQRDNVMELWNSGASEMVLSNKNYAKDILFYAAAFNESLLPILKKGGVDLNSQDEKGQTALFKAYQSNNQKSIDFLIKAGLNPDHKDKSGKYARDYKTPD